LELFIDAHWDEDSKTPI